jgi:glyoxylase-like metal-dependent hydrolase (beta-lactamase superfamily II)
MTHLHPDSNDGFKAMLPTDVTLIVHERAIRNFTGLVRGAGKAPTVLGVKDTLVLFGKMQTLEIHATASPAHTNHDLWVFQPSANVVYVGDLVTPTRCPMMSDPGTDPKGWIAALDRIEAVHAATLVPTRGPSTVSVADQIKITRDYIRRMLDILTAMKKVNAAEARVSGELVAKKVGEYCPKELDVTNALSLYRRMSDDGTFRQSKPGEPPTVGRPAPKKN